MLTARLKIVHRLVLSWYRREGRVLPWRNTRNPYRILVSEIMLQQTQIAAVLGPKRFYGRWLERFPGAGTLGAATGGSRAGFFLYRALWENHALPGDPYLMIHTGCEALAPPDASTRR